MSFGVSSIKGKTDGVAEIKEIISMPGCNAGYTDRDR